MENEEESQVPAWWRVPVQDAIARIKDENERARSERNARRWKAERDPAEYERQKERQREQYADLQGGAVRSYEKIIGTTKAERAQESKARDAARQKERYQALTPAERQAESDTKADLRFVKLRRKKDIPEDVIQALLVAKIAEREAKRAEKAQLDADEAAMRELPHYNLMGSGA